MTATLIAPREPGGRDLDGKGKSFLTWLVDLPEAMALTEPQLPPTGTSYLFALPTAPTSPYGPLILDGYTTDPVRENSDTHTWVTGGYSNDRSFRFDPREDNTGLGFKDWGIGIENIDRTLPAVEVQTSYIAGTANEVKQWDYENVGIPYTETELIFFRKVVLNTPQLWQLELIADANNTVFYYQGGAWLCKTAQNIPSIERGITEVSYEFHRDRGTMESAYLGVDIVAGVQLNTIFTALTPQPIKIYYTATPGPLSPYAVFPGTTTNGLLGLLPGLSDTNRYIRSPFHTLRISLRAQGNVAFVQAFNLNIGTAQQLAALPGNPLG